MAYINLSGDIILQATGSTVPTNVAKIFSCKKKINETTHNMGTNLIFRVYHGLNKMVVKEYYICITLNDTVLYDLTPYVNDEAKCFLDLKDDNIDIYFKPTQLYANTTIQFIETPLSLGFFKTYNGAAFDTDVTTLTEIIEPTTYTLIDNKEEISFTYQNNWANFNSTTKRTVIKKGNNLVNIQLYATNGTLDDGTILLTIDDMSSIPKNVITFPLTTYNNTNYANNGVAILTTDGNITLYNVGADAKRIFGNCSFYV